MENACCICGGNEPKDFHEKCGLQVENKRVKTSTFDMARSEVIEDVRSTSSDTQTETPRASAAESLNHEWNESEEDVTVTIQTGIKLTEDDVDVILTSDSANVSLKDGRSWSFTLSNKILTQQSRVLIRRQKIVLKLKKLIQNHTWSQLTKSGNFSDNGPCEKIDSPEKDKLIKCDTNDMTAADVPYMISHVKNSYFEKDTDLIVTVFVKNVNRETLDVSFDVKTLTMKFQTDDVRFLRLHDNTASTTQFCWPLQLREEIVPVQCRYKVNSSVIELVLRKKEMKRWVALEAPQPSTTDVLSSASSSWVSLGSQQSSSSLETKSSTASSTDDTATVGKRVMFDEISDVKLTPSKATTCLAKSELDSSQKPTCMVSPLGKSDVTKEISVFGMTGLDNLGNTCFMNSVLQCLANTRELRDYFLDSSFQKEINAGNRLGTGGRLACAFAVLLRILWSGKHTSFPPSKLKNLIALKASQFTGFAQHDAQELMAFLLDGLHEDLNRVIDKPYTESIDSDGRRDQEVADETWKVYKTRNDSFIVDLFQGQYKSKLVCPVCGKVSITFDPFLYLSVPLPKKQRFVMINFMFRDAHRRPVKYYIKQGLDSTVDQLKMALSQRTNVKPCDMLVLQADKSRIYKLFGKGHSLASVTTADTIIACEILSEDSAGEPVYVISVIQRTILPHQTITKCSYCKHECPPSGKLRRCSKCFKAAYCDQSCQRNHWKTHSVQCKPTPDAVGFPFVVSIPESQATYARLSQTMEQYARYSVDVFQPPPTQLPESAGPSASVTSCSSLESRDEQTEEKLVRSSSPQRPVVDNRCAEKPTDQSDDSSHCEKVDFLEKKTVLVKGTQQSIERGPSIFFIKPVNQYGQGLIDLQGARLQDNGDEPLDLSRKYYLSMDWRNNDKSSPYVLVQSKDMDCDEDEDSLKESYGGVSGDIRLDQCLSMFTEPETLSPEEAWYCPQCKEHREATKQMSIWRLPHTLIIQLKRFSFRNFICRDKIDKLVEFPTRGLDLTSYFVGPIPENEPPPVYDLYAVINHYGGILGGHYTSFARCPDTSGALHLDEKGWRYFDDSVVTMKSERQVMTKAAYVLFYRRRNTVFKQPSPPPAQSRPLDESSHNKHSSNTSSQLTLDGATKCRNESTSSSDDNEFVDTFQDQPVTPSRVNTVDKTMAESVTGYTDMDVMD